MSKFPMIEKLKLEIRTMAGCKVIFARDMESLLQSAQVVYGSPDTPSDQLAWSSTQLDCDTHKAILLIIEPLKKKTKAEAALELLEEMQNCEHSYYRDQAKRILEMKDEV